jgi:hypothetical protein
VVHLPELAVFPSPQGSSRASPTGSRGGAPLSALRTAAGSRTPLGGGLQRPGHRVGARRARCPRFGSTR